MREKDLPKGGILGRQGKTKQREPYYVKCNTGEAKRQTQAGMKESMRKNP